MEAMGYLAIACCQGLKHVGSSETLIALLWLIPAIHLDLECLGDLLTQPHRGPLHGEKPGSCKPPLPGNASTTFCWIGMAEDQAIVLVMGLDA